METPSRTALLSLGHELINGNGLSIWVSMEDGVKHSDYKTTIAGDQT